MDSSLKPLRWMGDSRRVLRSFSHAVGHEIGYGLYVAQIGETHADAKPLRGFGSGVFEIVCDETGNTYRAVYTTRFVTAVCVLHVFQKKSTRGIATPARHLKLIRQRLSQATELYGGKI